MKSTWFGDRTRYDFARLIHESDYSKHTYESFRLFLEAAYGSLRQGVHKLQTGTFDEKLEESVVKAQSSVKHPEKLTEAMSVLVSALEAKRYDFIGAVMGELGINDKEFRGQCFTPPDLCELIARMTLGECKPDPNYRLTIYEPACGGGAMMIAAANVLHEAGFYPWNYFMRGTDVDWKCYAITFIQLTLLGIPAWVIHGNSLSVQIFDSATTFVGALHPLRRSQLRSAATAAAKELIAEEPVAEAGSDPVAEEPVAAQISLPSQGSEIVKQQLTLFKDAG